MPKRKAKRKPKPQPIQPAAVVHVLKPVVVVPVEHLNAFEKWWDNLFKPNK